MESIVQQRIQQAFERASRRATPIQRALLQGLATSPATLALFSQFCRTISAYHVEPRTWLAGLHYLALTGEAPALGPFLPSCGGRFTPDLLPGLLQAAEALLADRREDLLDFLLAYQPREPEPRRTAPALLGALAAVERFGGGLSLVDLAVGGDGLPLLFDQFDWLGTPASAGTTPIHLTDPQGTATRLAGQPLPAIGGRSGLDPAPIDLSRPVERLVSAAFIPPDDLDRLARHQAACETVRRHSPLPVRQDLLDQALPTVLTGAYNAMAPGNTLLLTDLLSWPALDPGAQQRVVLAIQSLAAQVQPEKPIAWLQLAPFPPTSPVLELRLHTFGWADLEDRAVRRLAEVEPDLSAIRWLE